MARWQRRSSCLVYIFALLVLITTFASSESDDSIAPRFAQWFRTLNRMRKRPRKRRTPTPPTSKNTRRTLTLFWFRHIESDWNCKKVLALSKDSGISEQGKKQCIKIAENFGANIYNEFDQILKNAGDSQAFHFEASTLRRTQMTILPAWRSLLKQAQIARNADRVRGLENAEFYIMEYLQEASANIDAMSLFNQKVLKQQYNMRKGEMIKLNTKGGDKLLGDWEKYLKAGWGSDKIYNTNIFDRVFMNSGFDAVWGQNAYYVEGGFERLEALISDKSRIDDYGKWLRRQMNNGVALIIVGGHSKWFQYFVDKMKATDMKTDGNYGEDGDKVPNGNMVRVEVEAYEGNSIRIKSITKRFNCGIPACNVGQEIANDLVQKYVPTPVVNVIKTVSKPKPIVNAIKNGASEVKNGFKEGVKKLKFWGAMDYDNEYNEYNEYDDAYMMNDEYFDDVLEKMDLEELNELYDALDDALDELNDKYEEYGGETEEFNE